MPELEYFLLADSVTEDKATGALSIHNVLTEIQRDLPYDLPRLVVVSGWLSSESEVRERHESHVKLLFRIPGIESPYEFLGNMESESKHQHFNFLFEGIPLRGEGDLVVELKLNDVHMASHTVTVRQTTDAPAEGP